MVANLPEFILFGASLTEWAFQEETEGYGLFLEKKYQSKAHVVNEGSAGLTTTHLVSRFERIIDRVTLPTTNKTRLFTILVGANDACIVSPGKNLCPLPEFEANIRGFVDTILKQDGMSDTKVVLISTPNISINAPRRDSLSAEELDAQNALHKKSRSYNTYMNKKKYAEKVMQIAGDYEHTGRVVGLDLWNILIDAVLAEQGLERDEEKLPGSGLHGAPEFGDGWFTDGLHFDKKSYRVLSNALFEMVTTTWPDLAPENM